MVITVRNLTSRVHVFLLLLTLTTQHVNKGAVVSLRSAGWRRTIYPIKAFISLLETKTDVTGNRLYLR